MLRILSLSSLPSPQPSLQTSPAASCSLRPSAVLPRSPSTCSRPVLLFQWLYSAPLPKHPVFCSIRPISARYQKPSWLSDEDFCRAPQGSPHCSCICSPQPSLSSKRHLLPLKTRRVFLFKLFVSL